MNKLMQQLYFVAPPFAKNWVLSFSLLLQRKVRYGEFYELYLKVYSENLKKDEYYLKAYQLRILKKMLLEIKQHSLYYKTLFEENKISTAVILSATSVEELISKIPLLPKSFLKIKNNEIQNRNRKSTYKNFTSGTSGTPNLILYDDESLQIGFALWRRFHDWIDLPQRFKSVRLSGKILIAPTQTKPPFWVYNKFDQQLFMSAYHLTPENLPKYINKLNHFKPDLIDAYPSAIFIVAQFINSHKIKLSFKPKAIATTAETLYHHYKTEIEKAFGCPVYNQYSSSEGGPFIVECPQRKLHLNVDSGIFEFLNINGKPAVAGELAELVITSLRQWKMPLIRYQTGDWVKISADSFIYKYCECGCYMPTVDEIIGRQEDILYTKEKGFVGRMDTAYKGLDGIVKSKIIQHSMDYFEVLNETDFNYTNEIEKKLLQNFKDRLGEQVHIEIKTVSEIPLGAGGKFKAVERRFELPTA